LMIGMPPATAPSKATITPLACAAPKISLPCRASSALFAVTTCLPLAIACRMKVRAGSRPPISSTTMSMSGLASTVAASPVSSKPVPPAVAARACSSARSAIHVIRMGRPARRAISSALRCSTFHVPRPTVPSPRSPTCSGFISPPVIVVPASSRSLEQSILAEHLLDAAHRLPCPVLVLDHREADVLVAVLAEAHTRRHRDLRFGEERLRELERAARAIRLGNLRPHVHRRFRDVDHPSGFVQPLHQHVAPLLVLQGDFRDAVLRPLQRGDCRHLDRRERAVI